MNNAPTVEILIKVSCRGKHIIHRSDWCYIPSTQRVIKICGTIEKVICICNITYIPATDIAIKCGCTCKSRFNSCNIWSVPIHNSWWNGSCKPIIENGCSIKHSLKDSCARSIPIREILIKNWCVKKHSVHASNITYIPATDITVKCGCTFKHFIHSCYTRSIPLQRIGYTTCWAVVKDTILKCLSHIYNTACIPVWEILIKTIITFEGSSQVNNARNSPTT